MTTVYIVLIATSKYNYYCCYSQRSRCPFHRDIPLAIRCDHNASLHHVTIPKGRRAAALHWSTLGVPRDTGGLRPGDDVSEARRIFTELHHDGFRSLMKLTSLGGGDQCASKWCESRIGFTNRQVHQRRRGKIPVTNLDPSRSCGSAFLRYTNCFLSISQKHIWSITQRNRMWLVWCVDVHFWGSDDEAVDLRSSKLFKLAHPECIFIHSR